MSGLESTRTITKVKFEELFGRGHQNVHSG